MSIDLLDWLYKLYAAIVDLGWAELPGRASGIHSEELSQMTSAVTTRKDVSDGPAGSSQESRFLHRRVRVGLIGVQHA